jgi:hypothetical protein
MSRLAPTLLRSVLHLQAVALLLVEVTEVRNWLGVLGSGGRRRAHSSSYERFWCSGCRVVALLQAVCGVGEGGQRVEGQERVSPARESALYSLRQVLRHAPVRQASWANGP